VIDETLRMRLPAVLPPRNALADDTIGSFAVEAGEAVLPLIWSAHYHAEFWPNPYRFDPERFAPGAGKGRHTCSYIPFAAGPRLCIGNASSLIESTLSIAQLLTRVEVTISSCANLRPAALGSLRPNKPVRVRSTRRT
jgi:cytochrome P450